MVFQKLAQPPQTALKHSAWNSGKLGFKVGDWGLFFCVESHNFPAILVYQQLSQKGIIEGMA